MEGFPTELELSALPDAICCPVLLPPLAPPSRRFPPEDPHFLEGGRRFLGTDFAGARDCWQRGAQAKSGRCAYNLAVLLQCGLGGPRDIDRALRFYSAHSAKRLGPAMNNRAVLMLRYANDAEGATSLLEKAAQVGDMTARCNLALMWIERGNAADETTTRKMVERALRQGFPAACHIVGTLRHIGRLFERDPTGAFRAIADAAEAGYPPAMFRLAALYARGEGCDPDPALARSLIERAAANGVEQAQRRLAWAYALGEEDCRPDAIKALAYLSLIEAEEEVRLLRDTLAARLPRQTYGDAMQYAATVKISTALSDARWYQDWQASSATAPEPRLAQTVKRTLGRARSMLRRLGGKPRAAVPKERR